MCAPLKASAEIVQKWDNVDPDKHMFIEGDQALTFTIGIGPVNDPHRLRYRPAAKDKGSVVVECPRRFDHPRKPTATLPGPRLWSQQDRAHDQRHQPKAKGSHP